MKHPLFVGHFDTSVRSFKPKVLNPLDFGRVCSILINHCDKEQDGTPVLISTLDQSETGERWGQWLGQIEKEDVLLKDGYLICPWLNVGINNRSLWFIDELHNSLGVQIYEPGDARFYLPEQLSDLMQQLPRSGPND